MGIITIINIIGPLLDPGFSPLGASWTRLGPFSFFFWRSWSASWERPRAVKVPPEASPEHFGGYFPVIFVIHVIYIIKSVYSKNRCFMLVKRTILKISVLSWSIFWPYFFILCMVVSVLTLFLYENHFTNAICHILDPSETPFFRSWSVLKPV